MISVNCGRAFSHDARPLLPSRSRWSARTVRLTKRRSSSDLSSPNVPLNDGLQERTNKLDKECTRSRDNPILLFDIMDTVVYDPFYHHMPKFFDLSFAELMKAKHPDTWLLFERGLVDEASAMQNFFADQRRFDHGAFLHMMMDNYVFKEGMEKLLQTLNEMKTEMHAFSNYPEWYRRIEEKLKLTRYLEWTFVSCHGPMKGLRKPEARAYQVVLETLGCKSSDVLLVDDREKNVDAAKKLGIDAIRFVDAASLREELRTRGWNL